MSPEPLSPEWWVARLYRQLVARRAAIDLYDAYYRGDHPLPWLPSQARDEFRRILRMTRSNYMGLVVDATAERMSIEGFRIGDSETADAETWRIWQANNLDNDSDQAILESLIAGCAYMMVAPNPADPRTPLVSVEHPSQAIVEFEPGSNRQRRAAGLKVWHDDWTQQLMATLYLPTVIYKFSAPQRADLSFPSIDWQRREVRGEEWPARNPLGEVPLIEWANNPRLLTGGVSEIADVIDIQDRINKTIADRLITQDFGAFPQKWATGFPEEDEDGNPTRIDIGRDRLVKSDIAETSFGQWDAAPLDPYSTAKREDVKDIGSRTRVPAQYMLGEMSNVNGETLKASESGLIAKCRQRMRSMSESSEQTAALARKAAGLDVPPIMETIWRNPEFRTEGELTDAVVKRVQTGITSLRQAREDVGYSAAQIRRLEEDDARAAVDPTLERIARDLTGASGAAAVGG